MTERDSPWYRIGSLLAGLRDGLADAAGDRDARSVGLAVGGAAVATGLAALAVHLFGGGGERRSRRKRDRGPRWIRAAGAGLGATAAELVVQALLLEEGGGDPAEALEKLLEGAGDGVLYAALVGAGPPVPPVLAGAAYGVADYAARPWGGVSRALLTVFPGSHFPAPARALAGRGARGGGDLYEHLVFGIVLGLLYGSERSGTTPLVGDGRG